MAAAENTADIAATLTPAPGATPDNSPLGRLRQALANIKALNQKQKLAAAAALALAIALIVAALLWNRAPNQSVLLSNFDDRDGGEIIAALQQQNIPYSVSGDGRSILVPAGIVYETRLRLAAAGLPKGGQAGFELMDVQKLGVSQFNELVTYQRALEGELARTIQSISSVVAARVHLAMPKQTAFLRDDQKPTASVMVQLRPGRTLDTQQVAGIVHLVASSVPRMSDSGVTIVDQSGELLSREDPLRRAGLDPTQLRYIEEVENSLNRRIENILTPMYGKENFRAQVAADIDFNQVEQTAETYRPNPAPEQAVRSQQTSEQQSRDQGPQGVPGALTNQPPVPATAPITMPPVPPQQGAAQSLTNNSRSAVLNYELDRTIQHVKQSLGQIKRLSVAVVINHRVVQVPNGGAQPAPISEDEIARITSLVREAVGYNAARGDTINVAGSPFAEPLSPPAPPLWKDPEMVEMGKEGGKYVLMLVIILFAYFFIIRPLLRTIVPPPEPKEPALAAGEVAGEGAEEEGVDVAISEAAARANDYESRLARAREMVLADPKSASELVKQWLGVAEEGGRK